VCEREAGSLYIIIEEPSASVSPIKIRFSAFLPFSLFDMRPGKTGTKAILHPKTALAKN